MKIGLLVTALMFFTSSALVNANSTEQYIYKWKDAQGMVHYTERRPDEGIPFEKVRRESDNGTKSATPIRSESDSAKAKGDEPAKDNYDSWKKDNCKIAMQNLDILENAGKIAVDDGEGGKRLMTDEEIAEKLKKTTEQKNKYCVEEDSESK